MSQFCRGALTVIEARGHYSTEARTATVQIVEELGGNFSAEDVCLRIPGVGRATVYRTLRLLLDAGLICRVILADGSRRYSVSSAHHHHHLVCLDCGGVREFSRDGLEEVVNRLSQLSGYHVLGHRIELYGLCPTCANDSSLEVFHDRGKLAGE